GRDAWRQASGSGAQKRNESAGRKRESVAGCDNGNGDFDHCETSNLGKCSSASFGNRPENRRGGDGHEESGAAEGATGKSAGRADQTAACDFPRTAKTGDSPGG